MDQERIAELQPDIAHVGAIGPTTSPEGHDRQPVLLTEVQLLQRAPCGVAARCHHHLQQCDLPVGQVVVPGRCIQNLGPQSRQLPYPIRFPGHQERVPRPQDLLGRRCHRDPSALAVDGEYRQPQPLANAACRDRLARQGRPGRDPHLGQALLQCVDLGQLLTEPLDPVHFVGGAGSYQHASADQQHVQDPHRDQGQPDRCELQQAEGSQSPVREHRADDDVARGQ